MRVLISDPDISWSKQLKEMLSENSMTPSSCSNGKDCQLTLYKELPDAIILALETVNHSGLEVLRYLKTKHSKIKIIFTVNGKDKLSPLGLDVPTLKGLGVSDVLFKPYSKNSLLKLLRGSSQLEDWKKSETPEVVTSAEEEVFERDEEFTSIKAAEFCSGNHAIFDHYLKLGKGKYVKILHRGEQLSDSRVTYYFNVKKVDLLYFKTKDRLTYINFINEILTKALSAEKISTESAVSLQRNVTIKFVDEMYTAGLNETMLSEGFKICDSMYATVKKDKDLAKLMSEYNDYDPPAQTHLFLTSLFSIMICHNISWCTTRTIQMVSMGGFLHDIGHLKLPLELRGIETKDMSEDQLLAYQRHPIYGFELLDKFNGLHEGVKQIVLQHHESCNGLGYPYGLGANSIYPMAKIVSLADHFSDILIKNRVTPIQGLRIMSEEMDFTYRNSSEVIKALFTSFIKGKKDERT